MVKRVTPSDKVCLLVKSSEPITRYSITGYSFDLTVPPDIILPIDQRHSINRCMERLWIDDQQKKVYDAIFKRAYE